MSSSFAGVPGWKEPHPWRSEGVQRACGKGWPAPGDESPANTGCTVQYGRVDEFGIDGSAAFTCIFHLSSRGVALLGSTYSPPSSPLTRSSNDVTSSNKLPLVASYRRDRKPTVAATATTAVVFYYFTYLPYDDGGGRCMCSVSVLFFCDILTTLHMRIRPGGRSPRSYLRYVAPIIFLLFRHRYIHCCEDSEGISSLLFVLGKLAVSPS